MSEIEFILKKYISFFVQPYGIVISLLFFALFFYLIKKNKITNFFLSSAFVFIFLFSYPPFSNFLILNLENQYEKYDYKHDIKYIHVLGNGYNDDKSQPISSMISSAGLKRLLEGISIHQQTKYSKIIFTGYKADMSISSAKMNENLSLALGVKKENIILGEQARDTKEEALFISTLVADEEFVLVTSASHMPRAMKLFRDMGLRPVAAPTDFHKIKLDGYLYLPSPNSFINSQIAVHEYIGLLWSNLAKYY